MTCNITVVLHFLVICYSKKFALVEFGNNEGVSLVSSSWLLGNDKCYWPVPDDDVRKLASKHASVKENWVLCSCRILATAGIYSVSELFYVMQALICKYCCENLSYMMQ